MKSVIAIVVLGGALLWGQAPQQAAPASQQPKEKHVYTEDELVATRPADFVPSTPDPKKDADATSSGDKPDGAAKPAAAPADYRMQIRMLKEQAASQEDEIKNTQANLDAAPSSDQQDAFRAALERAKRNLQETQAELADMEKKQKAADEAAAAAKPAPSSDSSQQAEPKPDEQPH